jgi:hypothetical protein
MTFLDVAVNTFLINSGGINFLAFLVGAIIIYAIIIALIRPFDV